MPASAFARDFHATDVDFATRPTTAGREAIRCERSTPGCIGNGRIWSERIEVPFIPRNFRSRRRGAGPVHDLDAAVAKAKRGGGHGHKRKRK
jgi:hypothetical protein